MAEGKFRTDRVPVEIRPAGKIAFAFQQVERESEESFRIPLDRRGV